MNAPHSPDRFFVRRNSAPLRSFSAFAAALFLALTARAAHAEDWGAYALVPASAQAMVLEATGAGTAEGAAVSIGKPAGTANQKWSIVPKADNLYVIRPASSPTLVLAVAKGEAKNGAAIVLETESGQPWQLWALAKQENGSYTLTPKHAPQMGLDDFGGQQAPGSRIDLWQSKPGDQHLQWFIKPLAGSAMPAPVTAAAASVYEAPAIDPAEIKPGTTKQLTFKESAIFPGTVRDVTVFIPSQYDAAKPACVYVKTDGYNPKEKTLLETMIATKEIPVTVGVFVRPGEVPPPMKGTLPRRNRCYEYDGVGDDNVRFLVEELLPFVAKECALNLSTDGNDRCISGGSSGGIAAFTAAWHRPEAFSRAYVASGSFVAFRGGHEFPTLVRKFEAKPIRAYLTTGTHDMENAAGDWYLLDQEMDKALKFAGYDYFFRGIEGGHVVGYMDYWREAMAYLWKGWPARVQAGPSAPRARDFLLPEEGWQPVADGFQSLHGAACNAQGEVFFADLAANKIHRIDLEGKVTKFVEDCGHANGLTFGADGRLCSVSAQSGKILSYNAAGTPTVVAEGLPGHSILALPGGGFYVTVYGDKGEPGSVWHLKDGLKTKVDSGLKRASGLAMRPDQWLLSVADGASKWAYSYQVEPDGKLINKERYFWLHVADDQDDAGANAICYALEGQMVVATRSGIQVCADDGPTQVILPLPDRQPVTAVCLGGPTLDTLYAFTANKVWKRKVKVHAVGAFSPWTKVGGTKL